MTDLDIETAGVVARDLAAAKRGPVAAVDADWMLGLIAEVRCLRAERDEAVNLLRLWIEGKNVLLSGTRAFLVRLDESLQDEEAPNCAACGKYHDPDLFNGSIAPCER